MIETGEPLVSEGNFTLFSSRHQQPPFYFETINRGDALTVSAYPVFDYSRFQSGQNVEITTGFSINSDELLHRYAHDPSKAKRKYGYSARVQNGFQNREIYDVAGLFTGMHIHNEKK